MSNLSHANRPGDTDDGAPSAIQKLELVSSKKIFNKLRGTREFPAANAIWVGRALGPVHAACLSSFVAAGHKTVLHCYELPKDVPAGVEIADARRLMPENAIVCFAKVAATRFSPTFIG